MAGPPPVIDERARLALRRLEWRLRGRRVASTLPGAHRSIFRGRGMEFDQVVRFQFGDDIREIDWNVTARLGEVHRKIFVEDREADVVIVLADQPALQFGSGERTKRDVLLEAAALVMLLSAANRERVMLIHETAAGTRVYPPTRSRARLFAMIEALFAAPPPDPLAAASATSPIRREPMPRGALVVHVGEAPDGAPPAEWSGWRRRHRVIGVRAEDRWERDGPDAAPLTVYDPVTGHIVRLADDAATRARHAAWRDRRETNWRAWWPDPADRLTLDPDGDTLATLTGFLRAGAATRAPHRGAQGAGR